MTSSGRVVSAAVAGALLLLALSLVVSMPRAARAAGPLELCVGTGCVPDNTTHYVHWTSILPASGTATGTITLPGGHVVNLSFAAKNPDGSNGSFAGGQNACGTNFWNPSAPYLSPEVPNAPPNCELLQLIGGANQTYRLTLSEPIQDPVMAIVSLGSGSLPTTYDFDAPFKIVSQGTGFFGGTPTSLQQQPGDILWGAEGHGTIRFLGTFPTFSWTVPTGENWHGFTFGIRTTAQLAGQVIVNEGQLATNAGAWAGDPVTLTASAGTVVKNLGGTWNWSMPTDDGPAQSQTVTITATDGVNTTSKNFPLIVNNLPPAAGLSNNGPAPVGVPITASFTGQFDPSGPDLGSLHYAFSCSGAPLGTATYASSSPSASTTCTYPAAGPVTIRGRVIDKDGAFSEQTTTSSVLAPEGPPQFLHPIVTAFPNAPFTTCTQGIYKGTVSADASDTSLPEYWFVKAKASGTLSLAVNAVAVNTVDESGSITGTLTDLGGAPVGAPVTVAYPTGGGANPGDLNTGTITAGVTAGQIYRLTLVRNVASLPGTRPAHHYQLGFTGVAVDAGVNSPFVFEGGTQDIHVNVGSSGAISLSLTGPTAPAPGDLSTVSLQVFQGFTSLLTLPAGSVPASVSLSGLAPGNYLVVLQSSAHVTMTNSSVDDSGIYFDACGGVPQPPMGKVTIVKHTAGGDGTFAFTTPGGALPPSFPIATTAGTGQMAFDVPAGRYTFQEGALPPNWTFTSLTCTAGGAVNSQTATVNLVGGDDVVCTFTNTFVAPNQPPVAVDDSGTASGTTPAVIAVLTNDSDPDGGALSVVSATQGANGATTVDSGGTVTYTAHAGFVGTDTFTYVVTDGSANDSAVVTVTVSAAPTVCTDHSRDRDGKDKKDDQKDQQKDGKSGKDDDKNRKNVTNFSSGGDDHEDDREDDRDGDCGKNDPRMTGGGTIAKVEPAPNASGKDGKSKRDDGKSKGDDDRSKKDDRRESKWTWGFELRCDGSRGSFEYQDQGGGTFHLSSITGVVCSDDPAVGPGASKAGFDTMVMKGAGRWNGVAGHIIDVTLVDAGEPGTHDSIVLVVKTAGGTIVSQVAGTLSGGNHQAHR